MIHGHHVRHHGRHHDRYYSNQPRIRPRKGDYRCLNQNFVMPFQVSFHHHSHCGHAGLLLYRCRSGHGHHGHHGRHLRHRGHHGRHLRHRGHHDRGDGERVHRPSLEQPYRNRGHLRLRIRLQHLPFLVRKLRLHNQLDNHLDL